MLSAGVLLKMRIFGIKTEFSPHLLIFIAASAFIIPWRWLIAIFTAAAVHEIGHLLVLRISKVSVDRLFLSLSGARIIVEPLTLRQEFLCACAGPGAGILLLGLGRFYPELAICAFVQSIYNLIPLMPLDGGRILRCAAEALLPPNLCEKIIHGIEMTVFCGILFLAVICLWDKLVLASCVAMAVLLLGVMRKITCKGEFSAVQ